MDSVFAQTVLSLTQQNIKLMEENASLRAMLAKYQQSSEPETEVIVAEKPTKRAPLKKKVVADPSNLVEKIKNPGRVEAGKRLAIWNAQKKSIREEFVAAAKANSDEEW